MCIASGKWMPFQPQRCKEWDIRKFRREYRLIRSYAREADIYIPEDILFTQAFKALELTQNQRHLALGMLDNLYMEKSAPSLQAVSLRLFASYGSTFESTFGTHFETEVDETEGEEEYTWIAKGEGGKKRRVAWRRPLCEKPRE